MSLQQFVKEAQNQKSSEIDELREFQKILDETQAQAKEEKSYVVAFASTE